MTDRLVPSPPPRPAPPSWPRSRSTTWPEDQLGRVRTAQQDRPLQDIRIEAIEVARA